MVDTNKFKLPKALASDLNNSIPEPNENSKAAKKGVITVKLTNYRINQKLEDEFFKKK